jgi:hypothetical protein
VFADVTNGVNCSSKAQFGKACTLLDSRFSGRYFVPIGVTRWIPKSQSDIKNVSNAERSPTVPSR